MIDNCAYIAMSYILKKRVRGLSINDVTKVGGCLLCDAMYEGLSKKGHFSVIKGGRGVKISSNVCDVING